MAARVHKVPNVRPAIAPMASVAILRAQDFVMPAVQRKKAKVAMEPAAPLPSTKIQTTNAHKALAAVRPRVNSTMLPHAQFRVNVCLGIAWTTFAAEILALARAWPVQPPNAAPASMVNAA